MMDWELVSSARLAAAFTVFALGSTAASGDRVGAATDE